MRTDFSVLGGLFLLFLGQTINSVQERLILMKVGVFTETYAPQINGIVTSIENLNSFLKSRGHTPVVFTTGNSEGVEDEHGTPIHRFKSIPFMPYPEYLVGVPHVRKAVQFAETYEFDILHTHGAFSMGACALYAKKRLGLPLVGTFHTMLPEYLHYIVGERENAQELLKRPSWKFLSWYFNQCDATVAPSKVTARELKAQGFLNVKVVPNGVDTKTFHPVRSDFAKKNKIGKNYVLYLGRVSKEKNVDIIIETAKLLPETQFVIAGKGPYLDELKKMSPKNVFFAGFVSDKNLANIYSGAKTFMMPSVTDTQGLTVLESMACGTPVVCAPKRGPKELVENGVTGCFAKTAEAFAQCIKDTNADMGKAARQFAQTYSVEVCGEKMERLYEELLK